MESRAQSQIWTLDGRRSVDRGCCGRNDAGDAQLVEAQEDGSLKVECDEV